jgi:hypothetical protein
MPGEEPVVGGGGTAICCWASALPDSNANPNAAIADNLITMKASQKDIATPPIPCLPRYHSRNGAEERAGRTEKALAELTAGPSFGVWHY